MSFAMSDFERSFAVLLASLALAGCAAETARPTRPVYGYQGPTRPPPPVGSPLPAGWIWPVDPANPAAMFSFLSRGGVIRPIDLGAVLPYVGRDACSPVELG